MIENDEFLENLRFWVLHAEHELKESEENYKAAERFLEYYERNQPEPEPTPTAGVRTIAMIVLEEHNGPMHRKDIHEGVKAKGVYVKGKDPVATLGAILSRFNDDFYSCGDGMWDLKSRQNAQPAVFSIGDIGKDDEDDLPW